MLEYFRKVEKSVPVGVLGLAVGVISIIVGIYYAVIYETKPQLDFVVTSNSSVLDIKESVGNLDVLYKGESLNESNQSLSILTFRVINRGNDSILNSYYDDLNPVGFVLNNGTLAENASIVNSSDHYFEKNVKFEYSKDGKVTLPKVIIDSGQYFTVKLLVLHHSNEIPFITSVGKVAKVDSINVLTSIEASEDSSWLSKNFSGDLYMQLVRTVCYGLTFLISLIMLAMIIALLSSSKDKRKRKKLVASYQDVNQHKLSSEDDYLFNLYIENDGRELKFLYRHLADTELLMQRIESKVDVESLEKLEELAYISLEERTISKSRVFLFNDFMQYLQRKDAVPVYSTFKADDFEFESVIPTEADSGT
ncbi:TPA: hypothetical protein RQL13_004361 [Vibrio vulnificus]|nr:hypothetical protein [Vibrio vulnificus]HDY8201957.1 hypothetical protein [Vibrio vulnificus]